MNKPFAWITDESIKRLMNGGNGSRRTVPIHKVSSHTATIPIYLHKSSNDDRKHFVITGPLHVVCQCDMCKRK